MPASSAPTRCGTVAVVGAPNAGKSTLVNTLVGQKVAIVSSKVQTTRTRLMGIAIDGGSQLLLVDTPGIFAPRRRLDRAMVRAAWDGADGADVVLLVVDAKAGLKDDARAIIDSLGARPEPKMLALNKVDIAAKPRLLDLAAQANAMVPFAETFFISAETGDGVPELKTALAAALPEGRGNIRRTSSSTPPRACSPPRSPANSCTTAFTPNSPTPAPSRPRSGRNAATARPSSTSKSSSNATARKRSCWGPKAR